MFGGDYRWRVNYSGRLADYQQGRKLLAGEHFRFEVHVLVVTSSIIGVWSILLGSTNKSRLSWRPLLG
jgi:hypothetical protein